MAVHPRRRGERFRRFPRDRLSISILSIRHLAGRLSSVTLFSCGRLGPGDRIDIPEWGIVPANYLLHRVVIGRVSTGLSHTLSPFLFALEELMSCDTHQTALESRPAALPLPTVLRIADRGVLLSPLPPRAIVAAITLFHVHEPDSPNSLTFYYLTDGIIEDFTKSENERIKKWKEEENGNEEE